MQKRIGMLYCIGKWNAIGVLLPIFFIPARGRKPDVDKIREEFAEIFFIPARGRKLPAFYSTKGTVDFLYPREGTET